MLIMKHKNRILLAGSLLLPVLSMAQLSAPDGLTTVVNHEFNRTGENPADETAAAGQPDSADGVTVWDGDLDEATKLANAGYTVYNGNDEATWPHYLATQVDGEQGYLRLRPVDAGNGAVEGLDIGVGVQFAAADKGFVSLEWNFIGTGLAYFYMQLLNGTEVVASLEIVRPDPVAASDVNWTTGAGTTDLAVPGVTDFVSTNGAPDLTAVTPVQIAWEGSLVDFYLGDVNAGATTILDQSLMGNATEVTEFRIIANVPAGSANKNRMRVEELMVQAASGEAPTWALWPILDEAGNVDTSPWMGFLNVINDPWIWSYSLNQWLYIDGNNVTESGSWAYLFNL